MFSSIRWKFILVYFLLVFIAMIIVGVFIVESLEKQQIKNILTDLEQKIESIVQTSSYVSEDDWVEVKDEIQETLNEWRLGSNDILYVIYNEDIPTILASTSRENESIIGENAFSYKTLDPTLILKAFNGEKASDTIKEINDNTKIAHLVYPVLTDVGQVKGLFYMTTDLQNVYITVNSSKRILTNATLIALLITVVLGFIIASSITEPIGDVTRKAEEMAGGNLDQFVEVKSDDEIGQLASMFNYMTLRLKDTLQQMDLEKSKLDTIFNYMAEGVIAVDVSGNIIHANPIALDILSLDRKFVENLEELTFPFELSTISLDKIDYDDETTLEGDQTFKVGKEVYKVKYAPFKNERNTIGGIIIVFQDITSEHRLDNMRKEFVANVSHELKTPITTIKSYTETLMADGIDDITRNKFLGVIENECDRMGRLVRDLLQLSNLDNKSTMWQKQDISLSSLLNDILSKLDFAFKEKNHTLIRVIEKDIPSIMIDRDGIEQVILNVIYNAIKYTEVDGEIRVSANVIDDYISISVSDNGIGIPLEDQKRIFERFYRVEKGRSRELGGTGLGLSIARQIVLAHKGHISLQSEFEVGTTVKIELPLTVI